MKGISLLVFLMACSSPKKESDPIREVFMGRIEKYRQCYLESEQYQGRHEKKTGQLKVWMAVNEKGIVKEAKILETEFKKDPNFEACILGQLKQLKFKNDTPLEITQPLHFEPGQS